ncbi:DNA-cytosine methyltransferase [Haloferax prahovense DSM 18310]|uniref:DNA (cytosine-5-)-methyltransferase n=1 Tax=Haloferax prahovense (strain DSM 18310 / JCM 13924 / TL6) TaxID=1227461 RepID=M0GCP0_HALPT|nr:DNA cytosine methyltransferase [Haloferax prahovense]ELZ68569.1 DNA-cytosine methyltransferase [Haloferax prahovense DSM 18310]
MNVSAVDLFCGAGGLTNGLEAAGVTVEAGFDIDADCRYAYEENNDAEFVDADLAEISRENPEEVAEWLDDDADATLVAGCPPCQPFSPLNHGSESQDHEMYEMLSEFGEIVAAIEPDFVVMENVYELRHEGVYEDFEDLLESMGYLLNPDWNKRVFCPEYGIPQTRRRWVVTASKRGPFNFSPRIHNRPSQFESVKERIDDLPAIEAGESHPDDWLHTARSLDDINLKRIEQSVPGGTWEDWDEELLLDCHLDESGRSFGSVYGRMRADEPAPTITTQFYNLGSGRFGHYDTDQNRAISLREGAMIQTFPRDYQFAEKFEDVGITKLGRMIGNAVPPALGEIIGRRLLEHLRGEKKQAALGDYVD